ncbi:MAG: hypothetical protein E4H01_01740, partial [Lysobacterales bacterium]
MIVSRAGTSGAGGWPGAFCWNTMLCRIGVWSGHLLYRSPKTSFTGGMSWMETDKIRQRKAFVDSYASGQWSMSELCEHFGVSQPTGYLWVSRFDPGDLSSLSDRSGPRHHANQTDLETIDWLLWLRDEYGWGAKKLSWRLERDRPDLQRPVRSTGWGGAFGSMASFTAADARADHPAGVSRTLRRAAGEQRRRHPPEDATSDCSRDGRITGVQSVKKWVSPELMDTKLSTMAEGHLQ